jgi:hypothetical protein
MTWRNFPGLLLLSTEELTCEEVADETEDSSCGVRRSFFGGGGGPFLSSNFWRRFESFSIFLIMRADFRSLFVFFMQAERARPFKSPQFSFRILEGGTLLDEDEEEEEEEEDKDEETEDTEETEEIEVIDEEVPTDVVAEVVETLDELSACTSIGMSVTASDATTVETNNFFIELKGK